MDFYLLLFILLLYSVLAISLVIGLLLYGARPSKTLAWLLAIFTIPVGGILLYLLFGRNRRKRKLFVLKKEYTKKFEKIEPSPNRYAQSEKKIHQLIYNTTGFPVAPSSHMQVLRDGKETFKSIFDALERANHQIHIQYYIFEDGVLAQKLLNLFERKIKQNVEVRLLYDGIGSYSLSRKYLKNLKDVGVEVEQFLPFRFGRFLSSLNYRNHRKIIVVDNAIGFTGGINISDKYVKGDPNLGKWHDTHIRLEGEAATLLNRIFFIDWYLATEKSVEEQQISLSNNRNTPTYDDVLVQIVPSGPDDDFAVMEQVYFSIINQAKQYVYITNPYIIPNQAILQSLKTAALSGVDVRLLLSASTDIKVVDWCVQSYFEQYLEAGVKVYRYPDGFLHSKTLVSDNRIASIGTANLDDRSLHQNYEVNVIVYDRPTSLQLREDFLKNCSSSEELDYLQFQERHWGVKLLEGTAKLLSPLL
jgi:cardiolipin synthase